MANINWLFNGTNNVINDDYDYDSMILEAKRKLAAKEPEPKPSKAKGKRENTPLELPEEFINKIQNNEKI